MKRIAKGIGIMAAAGVLAVSLAASGFAGDTAMGLKVGDKAPDFKLKDVMTGQTVNLSDYAGKKIVMLDFWATWCDICKKEMPNLVKLQNQWKDKNFEIVSIVLQSGDTKEVKKIIVDKKLNYPALLDHDLSVATKLYGLSGPIPLKVVIDWKGIIRYSHVGDYPPGEEELPYVLDDLTKEMAKETAKETKK
jgi:peroxiredoxin